jgi:hypothetical protein
MWRYEYEHPILAILGKKRLHLFNHDQGTSSALNTEVRSCFRDDLSNEQLSARRKEDGDG